MTEQLNLLPCPMCGNSADLYKLDGYHTAMCSCGVRYEGISAERCATAWNRRAAPIVGDDGLPPLPGDEELRKIWREGTKAAYAAWSASECELTRHGWMMRKVYEAIASKVATKVRDAIAADQAARAQQQAQSVGDDPKFSELLSAFGYNWTEGDERQAASRDALIAYIDGRTAGAVPQFNSDDELVAWLDTLHECDGNGTVHNRKWEPAQRAIKGIRAIEAKAVSGMDRAELQIEVFKLRAAINTTELEGGYKLVPLEPTEAMVHAAEDLPAPRMFGAVYRAMLAAAPSPQPGKEGA